MTSTAGWLSAAVEKICDFVVGIVVFLGISGVITPPIVSIPNVKGVTSSKTTSWTSPAITPPWIAAPIETASSGWTSWLGFLPNNFLTNSWTAGIRIDPPIRITWAISFAVNLASLKALRTGSSVLSNKCFVKSWNLALVKVVSNEIGPLDDIPMNGNEIVVSSCEDNAIFASSAASLKRCKAILSLKSTPCWILICALIQSAITLSQSSPPRWLSPAVEITSYVPSPISRIDTSNVPPPKSYTRTFSLALVCVPYANAAAVGSLIIRTTSRPAIWPASLVAWRWASLK